MQLAITIVHNKGDAQNEAQLQALIPLVIKVVEPHTDPETGETFTTTHYELDGLSISHEVRFYQVVPYGVARPPSFALLDSHNVLYGPEDADKGETRFFNWGLKRSTDYGADISVYLADTATFSVNQLLGHLTAMTKRPDATGFIEDTFGKLTTVKQLREVGQLDEKKPFSQAVSDLKTRVTGKGLQVA